MAIEISDNALTEVRRRMEKERVDAAGMRVGVKGGGWRARRRPRGGLFGAAGIALAKGGKGVLGPSVARHQRREKGRGGGPLRTAQGAEPPPSALLGQGVTAPAPPPAPALAARRSELSLGRRNRRRLHDARSIGEAQLMARQWKPR